MEKKVFFAVKEDGCLVRDFVGTIDELHQRFLDDKKRTTDEYEKQIKAQIAARDAIKRPKAFDKLLPERQIAIDKMLEAQRADKDATIAMLQKYIEKTKALQFSDMEYFVLTPVAL